MSCLGECSLGRHQYDAVNSKSKIWGTNITRGVLLNWYSGALDIPREPEVTNLITSMMTQAKKGQTVLLGDCCVCKIT